MYEIFYFMCFLNKMYIFIKLALNKTFNALK